MNRLAWLALPLVALSASVAHAQTLSRAAVLETRVAAEVGNGTGGAVDRLLRGGLDRLEVVSTAEGVSLDLAEVQLALGCVGETAECLDPVASELSVRLLLVPILERADDEFVLSVALFDADERTLRRALRRASTRAQLLDSIDGLLRELFSLPPASANDDPEPRPPPAPTPPPPAGDELSPWPIVVASVGAVALLVAGGLGVGSMLEQDAYANARPTTPAEADAALGQLARAEDLALGANILFVAGGAIALGGLTWLVVDLLMDDERDEAAAFTPVLGPGYAGLSARGTWSLP